MIRIAMRSPDDIPASSMTRRRRFGLDAPLPAAPHVIERAVLRHLDETHPDLLVLAVRAAGDPEPRGGRVDLAAGVPELLLLRPGGRLACLKIKTQAQTLTRDQKAFADLCRALGIPFHVVRSLAEARAAVQAFARERPIHG